MPCRERHHVFKVLTGELSPGKSAGMLEHFRRCGECREAFEFAAKTISKTSGMTANAEPDSADRLEIARTALPGSWPAPVRRNRRTLIVFGVAILAAMLAGVGRGRGDAALDVEPAAEIIWRRSLAEGTPVVLSPAGSFEARPRVITALVPLGSGSMRLAILDDAGRVAFQREAKPGEGGCFLEEAAIDASGGTFHAGRLMIPFPDDGVLALDPGRGYGVLVAVAGGHTSSSTVFRVGRPEGALQGVPGEER